MPELVFEATSAHMQVMNAYKLLESTAGAGPAADMTQVPWGLGAFGAENYTKNPSVGRCAALSHARWHCLAAGTSLKGTAAHPVPVLFWLPLICFCHD